MKILHCNFDPDTHNYFCSTKTQYGWLYPEKCELILKYDELFNYIKNNRDKYIYELPCLVASDFKKKLEKEGKDNNG